MTTTLPTPTHPTVGSPIVTPYTAGLFGDTRYRAEPDSLALRRLGWRAVTVDVGLTALSARYVGTVEAYRVHPDPCDEAHDPYTDRVETVLRIHILRTIRAAYSDKPYWLGAPELRLDPQLFSDRVRIHFEEV